MNLVDLVGEGLGAAKLPCAALVAVPGLAAILPSGRRWVPTTVTFVLSAGLFFWLRAAGWFWDRPDRATMVILGTTTLLSVAGVAAERRGRAGDGSSVVGFGSAGWFGLLAAWLWAPCVGANFGDALTTALVSPGRALPPLLLYVSLVCFPLLLIASLWSAWPRLQPIRDHRATALCGVIIGAVLGALLLAGWYDDVAAELNRLSAS